MVQSKPFNSFDCETAAQSIDRLDGELAASLAREAKMRDALEDRIAWHKCSCPEPCDDYNVFPGGCAARYGADYQALVSALALPIDSTALQERDREIIERCAKIAEADCRSAQAIEHDYKPTWFVRAQQIAADIRALAVNQTSGGENV